jgi:hypothetical protein
MKHSVELEIENSKIILEIDDRFSPSTADSMWILMSGVRKFTHRLHPSTSQKKMPNLL